MIDKNNIVLPDWPYCPPTTVWEELQAIKRMLEVERTGERPGTCNNYNADIAKGFKDGKHHALAGVMERIYYLEETLPYWQTIERDKK